MKKGYLRNVVNESYVTPKSAPIFGGPMITLLYTAEDIEAIAQAVEAGKADEDMIKQLYGIASEMKEYYEQNK